MDWTGNRQNEMTWRESNVIYAVYVLVVWHVTLIRTMAEKANKKLPKQPPTASAIPNGMQQIEQQMKVVSACSSPMAHTHADSGMRSANAKQWLQLLRFCFQPGACDPWRICCVTTRIKMSHVQHGNFQCHTDPTIYYTHSRSYIVLRHLSLGLPWIVLPAKVRTKAEAHARNVKGHILLEKNVRKLFLCLSTCFRNHPIHR